MHAQTFLVFGALFASVEAGCSKLRLSTGVEVEKNDRQEVTLKCVNGYVRRHGESTVKCLFGRWQGRPLTCRKDTRCPDPGRPIAGDRNGHSFWEDHTVRFTCRQHFRLEGEKTARCLSNKTWSSPLPVCKRARSCPDPGFLANTNRTSRKWYEVDGFGPGDAVTYMCNKGFLIDEFIQYETITCKEDGKWGSMPSVDGCQAVKCDPLNIKRSMRLIVEETKKTSFGYGDLIRFSCNESYELHGPSAIRCDEFGEWTPYQRPTCALIKCPAPPIPENGQRIGNSFLPGDTVSFQCAEGHTMRGSENRTCLNTRQWSGTTTVCEREGWDCPDPGIPVGAVKIGSSYNIGDTVKYTCQPDFIQRGSKLRKCLKNGMWSGEETYCIYKYSFDDAAEVGKKLTEQIDTISLSTSDSELGSSVLPNMTQPSNRSNLGRALDLNNQFGLDLILILDLSGSINNESVNVAKQFLTAIVKKVGASDKLDGTRVNLFTFNKEVKEIHSRNDEQSPDTIIDKINQISNDGEDATALKRALDKVVNNVATIRIVNAKASIAMILLTDGNYNWGGDPGEPAERLRQMKVDMYCIGIGNKVDRDTLEKVSKQTFRLVDLESLGKVTQDILNNSSKNSYEECGVGGLSDQRPDKDPGDFQAAKKIKNWPWMAGLHKGKVFLCGASLIRPQWLLTAAHCFTDSQDPDDFKIRLGTLLRKTERSIEFDIRKIIIHPNFTLKPHELHDVALLKLEKTVVATPTIRPICLPDSYQGPGADEPNWYKAGKWAVVTGWGDERKLKLVRQKRNRLSDSLHYISMPIQKDTVCTTSKPKESKLKYEKIFCAGDGNGKDSCRGDSGGPVSVKLGDPKRVFQIGIVSFGYGCRQKDTYGYYTRVADYMPWILEHVDKGENE